MARRKGQPKFVSRESGGSSPPGEASSATSDELVDDAIDAGDEAGAAARGEADATETPTRATDGDGPSTESSVTSENGRAADEDRDATGDEESSAASDDEGSDDESPGATPTGARRARQRAIRAALATLPVPDPEPGFWAGLDVAMAEQKPLAITARPAIRPITEPPPLSQPKPGAPPSDSALRISTRTQRDGRDMMNDGSGRRRLWIVVGLFVVGLLIVGSALAEGDDSGSPDTPTSTTASAEETTTTREPTTTAAPQIRGLDALTAMTPNGVGPLLIGSRLGDLEGLGVEPDIDQTTFAGTGGRCFDVRLPAAAASDLVLRYRSPDPATGVQDPRDAMLAAITITAQVGSQRGVEGAGLGLHAPIEEIRRRHQGEDAVEDTDGSLIYVIPGPEDSPNGIAYATDGRVATEITVGALDAIQTRQPCL